MTVERAPQETQGDSHNTLMTTPSDIILIGEGGRKSQPKLSFVESPERLMHYDS